MANVFDVDVQMLLKETAKRLKEEKISVPSFVPFVKTGMHKERPPVDDDWWYLRCAAILRTVAIRGPVGTSKLRTKYGGRKNNGAAPEHHARGSGSVIRKALQALEEAGYLKKETKEQHKGRVMTGKGHKLLTDAIKAIGVKPDGAQ